jgi:hypothetical protein
MQTGFRQIKEALGRWFLAVALNVLPKESPARIGALRGLVEQRAYDRYEGWTQGLGKAPLPFDRWREIRATFALRRFGRAH